LFGFNNTTNESARSGHSVAILSCGKDQVRLARRRLQAIGHGCSKPFFLQVVNIEPVVHDAIARDELLDVILHVLLEFQRQIAQVQIAFLIIPGDDFCAWAFLSVLANPRRNLIVSCPGGNE